MRDETNIKTNFLGRDGFRWFIGQIPKNAKAVWGILNVGVIEGESELWGIILERIYYQM